MMAIGSTATAATAAAAASELPPRLRKGQFPLRESLVGEPPPKQSNGLAYDQLAGGDQAARTKRRKNMGIAGV